MVLGWKEEKMDKREIGVFCVLVLLWGIAIVGHLLEMEKLALTGFATGFVFYVWLWRLSSRRE